MALTAVQICNLALAHIGITQAIADLDEASNEAQTCKLLFEPCRDDLLGGHEWPFMNRTADLGLVATDPTTAWAYSYRLPADCFVARSIGDAVPFTITSDSAGMLLYCSINPATLTYSAQVTDPALLPHDVAMALSWRMAMDLAPALSRTEGAADRAERGYLKALNNALSNRLNEAEYPAPDDAETITGRA